MKINFFFGISQLIPECVFSSQSKNCLPTSHVTNKCCVNTSLSSALFARQLLACFICMPYAFWQKETKHQILVTSWSWGLRMKRWLVPSLLRCFKTMVYCSTRECQILPHQLPCPHSNPHVSLHAWLSFWQALPICCACEISISYWFPLGGEISANRK